MMATKLGFKYLYWMLRSTLLLPTALTCSAMGGKNSRIKEGDEWSGTS